MNCSQTVNVSCPKFELLATNSLGQALMATPALSEGMLILRAENYIYALAESGAASRQTEARRGR